MGAQKAVASGGKLPDRCETAQSVLGKNSSNGSKWTLSLQPWETDGLRKVKVAYHGHWSIYSASRLSDFKPHISSHLNLAYSPKNRDTNNCPPGILQRFKATTCGEQFTNRSAVQQNDKVIKSTERSESLLNQNRAGCGRTRSSNAP